MEKFYRLEPESKLHNDYVEYMTNEDAVRKAFGAIAVKYDIDNGIFPRYHNVGYRAYTER